MHHFAGRLASIGIRLFCWVLILIGVTALWNGQWEW